MKRLLATLGILAFAATTLAAVKWWEPYKKGMAAVHSNDWATVAAQMEKAIALKPAEELAAKVSRNETLVYIPHYWLGLAKFKLGDVEGALREWKVSQGQGVVQKTQYYADLQSWRAKVDAAKTKTLAQGSAESRKAADETIKRAVSGQTTAMVAGADRLDSFRAAQRKLQESLEHYDQGARDANTYKQAMVAAGQAEKMFAAAAEEARSRKAARATPPRPAPQRVAQQATPQPPPQAPSQTTTTPATPAEPPPTVVTQVTETISPAPEKKVDIPAPEPGGEPEIQSATLVETRLALVRLQRKLSSAKSVGDSDPKFSQFLRSLQLKTGEWSAALDQKLNDSDANAIGREIATLEGKLSERLELLKETSSATQPSSTEVRTQLQNAYFAFARGNTGDSEAELNRLIARNPRSAEALLLRGCSRYTRAMIEKDDRLLAAATADFTAALRLSPTITLDARYFSPKLTRFFDEVRQKQTAQRTSR